MSLNFLIFVNIRVAALQLLNGRCTSLLRTPISEMTYTVLSETLNSSIPYYTNITVKLLLSRLVILTYVRQLLTVIILRLEAMFV